MNSGAKEFFVDRRVLLRRAAAGATLLAPGMVVANVGGPQSMGAPAASFEELAGPTGAQMVGYGSSNVADTLPVTTASIGAVADGATDVAGIISSALADPAVAGIELGDGIYAVGSPIIVPTGKFLRGRGRARTLIRKIPIGAPQSAPASVILSEFGANDISLSDFSVDGNRSGLGMGALSRCHGVILRTGDRFSVQRVDVYNCTGYAHWANGDSGNASGSYQDCHTYNNEVHFEQSGCDGVLLIDCHARSAPPDGGPSIPCEAFFHQLNGARNVTLKDCTGYGSAGAGVTPTTNFGDLENIALINCHIENLVAIALFTGGGDDVIHNLMLTGCSFISRQSNGVSLGKVVRGTAVQCRFQGDGVGISLENSDVQFTQSDALGERDPDGGLAAFGVYVTSGSARWNGGTIRAVGPVGLIFPTAGNVSVSLETVLDPPSPSNLPTDFAGPVTSAGSITSNSGNIISNVTAGSTAYMRFAVNNITRASWALGGDAITLFGDVPSTGNYRLRVATADRLVVNNSGVNITGEIRVAGVKVVGSRGAAVADAVNETDAVARLNELLARLRAHGLIAS